MLKKILLICNRHSGKAQVNKYVENIVKTLEEQEFEIDIRSTKIDLGADKIIELYDKKVDMFLICGGDGTLSQTINGVVKSGKKVPVLYIPFGTTNDFARTLKLPKNKYKCIEKLKEYKKVDIDVGKFKNKFFYYIAVFGVLSNISYTTPQKEKNKYGRLAYYKQALKEARTREIYKMKIECEDRIIEDEFIYGSISNSTSIAGFKWFKDSEAELDDGEFEVILIRKIKTLMDLIRVFIYLVFKIKNEKYLYCFKTANLKILCDKDVSWTLDGENGGMSKKVTIENMRKMVGFLVPKKNKIKS